MQSYLEDDFQLNEIEMLKRYIKPEDHRRTFWDPGLMQGACSSWKERSPGS